MPGDRFVQPEYKELTQQQLESFLEVQMVLRHNSTENALHNLAGGVNGRFIVMPDYKLYVIVGGVHNDIFNKLDINRGKALWDDGYFVFRINENGAKREGRLIFKDSLNHGPKVKNLREAATNKIKAYLNDNGFNIE